MLRPPPISKPLSVSSAISKEASVFLGLQLKAGPTSNLSAFSDADWGACPDDCRSTTADSVFLGTNLLSWGTKKRLCPGLAPRPNIKLLPKKHLNSYGFPTCFAIWVFLSLSLDYCDNISATHMAVNPVFHARTKDVEIDYHFVREKVARGDLKVLYVRTDNQTADVFTKGLSSSRFLQLRDKSWLLHHGDEQRGVVRASSGQMLNESLGESLDPAHVYQCSIKTGPNTVIPRLVITPRVFAAFISTIKHATVVNHLLTSIALL